MSVPYAHDPMEPGRIRYIRSASPYSARIEQPAHKKLDRSVPSNIIRFPSQRKGPKWLMAQLIAVFSGAIFINGLIALLYSGKI